MTKSTATADPDPSLEAELAYFNAIPWCAEILRSATQTTIFEISHPDRHRPKGRPPAKRRHRSKAEEMGLISRALFSRTLNTPDAIPHFVTFYDPQPPVGGGGPDPNAPQMIPEVRALLSLGPGVDGILGVCHGGVVAAILDEGFTLLAPLNQAVGAMPGGLLMTAYLNVRFFGAVRTPSTVLSVSRIARVEGRKYHCEGEILDGDGKVLASAEALFVSLEGSSRL